MRDGIIEIRQLPVIYEQLHVLKQDIEERTAAAVAMECTEDTVKEVKKIRAELNKECKEYEDRRRAVKRAVLAPYEAFNAVYEDCVTSQFKRADAALKGKIDAVENDLKEQKRKDLISYAQELKLAYGLYWLDVTRILPNVTLSASLKSLKKDVCEHMERINLDFESLNTEEEAEERAEFMKTLDSARARLIVQNRRKEIEAARAAREKRKQLEAAQAEAVERVEATTPPPLSAPTVKTEESPAEKVFRVTFTVEGTKDQLRAMKDFMATHNIKIIGG